MDRYHIFNEIGAGRQSQVFKGRCKMTVNYVAIKRVEKGQMEKVVNEVQVMHCLSHPHTLKFYDWYETRNNLWLILEYCSGGDLKSLLKSDVQLPLRAVKLLAGDLFAGLQYLHYSGILYCDLKPTNVLIDEYGVLKLAGFGVARRIPTSTNKSKAPKNRGTPYYMAPELFLQNGVHSYGSDLWSLGVVLYELATGRPPFASASLNELMHHITNTQPDMSPELFLIDPNPDPQDNSNQYQASLQSNHNDDCSLQKFSAALALLLDKDATKRPNWDQLHHSKHSFWYDVIPPPPADRSLAPQPLFDAFIAALPRQNNGSLTFPDQNSKTATQQSNDQQNFQIDTAAEDTTVLRLSTSYQAHMRRSRARQEVADAARTRSIEEANRMHDSDDPDSNGIRSRRRHHPPWWQREEEEEEENGEREHGSTNGKHQNASSNLVFAAISDSQVSPILGASATSEHQALAALRTAFPNTTFAAAYAQHRHHLARGHGSEYTATLLRQLPADILPLEPKPVEILQSMPHDILEAHLVLSYKAIVAATKTTHILAVVAYLQLASEVMHVANVVINSSFVSILLQMLRTSDSANGNAELRSSILVLVGMLMRQATYIVPDPDSGLVTILLSVLADERRQSKERELALAALGELAFYVATQDIHEEDEADPQDDDSALLNENDSRWRLFRKLLRHIVPCLDSASDAGLVYYGAKTVGNILAQARPIYVDALSDIGHTLTTPLTRHAARALASSGSTEPGRVSAYALVQLLRPLVMKSQQEQQHRSTALRAFEALGGASALSKAAITALVRTDDAKWQLTTLNLLNTALKLGLTVFENEGEEIILARSLAADARLSACLVRALGGGGCVASTVRAKSALAILQIGTLYPPALARAIDPTLSQANLEATRLLDAAATTSEHHREFSSSHNTSNAAAHPHHAASGNKGTLVVALDRLAARDAHDLANDEYLSECALLLTGFVADCARACARCAAEVALIAASGNSLDQQAEVSLRSLLRDCIHFGNEKEKLYKQRLSTDMSLTEDLTGASFEDNLIAAATNSFDGNTNGKNENGNYALIALGSLPLRELAAVLPLTASAAASPLLRPRIVTPAFLSDLGRLLASIASFVGASQEEFRLVRGLTETLDGLLTRDAELLMPHLAIVFKSKIGLLPAICDLFPNADRDLRLTGAQLLRHSVPPLLHGMQRAAPDDESLLVDVHDLLSSRLPLACVSLLTAQTASLDMNVQPTSPNKNNLVLESECMLRLLLETLPRWPAATGLFAAHNPLILALHRTASSPPSTSLPGLATQLLVRLGFSRL